MKKVNPDKQYFFRSTQHIEEDMQRNWSSWSFGHGGISTEKLESYIDKIENGEEVYLYISLFEEYIEPGSSVCFDWLDHKKHYFINNNIEIAELYSGYWVLIDNINAKGGLSVIELNSINFADMINESIELSNSALGNGDSISSEDVSIFYKTENYSILEGK